MDGQPFQVIGFGNQARMDQNLVCSDPQFARPLLRGSEQCMGQNTAQAIQLIRGAIVKPASVAATGSRGLEITGARRNPGLTVARRWKLCSTPVEMVLLHQVTPPRYKRHSRLP